MRRRALACAVAAVLVASGTGCSADSGGPGDECAETDPAVVKEIMAGARSDFSPPVDDAGTPGPRIDHLEARESVVGKLPQDDRKFGADRLVVLLVSTVLGEEDAADDFGSYQEPLYFALDAKGELIGPAGSYTTSYFDLASPADPEWLAWGDKVESSTLGNDLFGCVNPA